VKLSKDHAIVITTKMAHGLISHIRLDLPVATGMLLLYFYLHITKNQW